MRRDLQHKEKNNIFIKHEPCPNCQKVGADTTGNNLARYSDNSAYCFACEYHEKGNDSMVVSQ